MIIEKAWEQQLEVKVLRGQLRKQENRKETKIERKFLSRHYSIKLNKELCNGCGVCAEVCPKEAIKEVPAVIEKGILVKKPTIEFDTDSCIFCGECAVLCPLNALTMKIDGKEISMIVKNEAFPSLLKGIEVSKEKVAVYDYDFSLDSLNATEYTQLLRCSPECEVRCQKECPTEAIEVSVQKSENNQIAKIVDVNIDESKCIYCKRCELACPYDAIKVKKPFHGTLELKANLCPEDCMACQDICPSQAIKREDGKLVVSTQFCIFCSACQKICPEKAITVKRDWIFHTDIKSAAWLTALKKLTSIETVSKELRIKALNKKVRRVKDRRISEF
jgi:4Fe-4S ferredoxin